jgi:hypothetical protein
MNWLDLRLAMFKQWWQSILLQAYIMGGQVVRLADPKLALLIEEQFRQAGWSRMADGWAGKP